MTDTPNDQDRQDAATEAAQNVVDDVTSWNYSGDRDVVESELDEGLDEAGVVVPPGERERILEEIDELKHDEGRGIPDVREAGPAE
jgi:hypothetical protein